MCQEATERWGGQQYTLCEECLFTSIRTRYWHKVHYIHGNFFTRIHLTGLGHLRISRGYKTSSWEENVNNNFIRIEKAAAMAFS
jgi:hypothetical protein